ncbi:hypothetical protein [Streptomyces scabiei]|uniref:hypothetical protein n=1 Tax=Streptomyces scabiei TaxID=1930 RepID=UPI001FF44175|nr:hypothetical protein [Streptomyces sp. LBUM 1481]
MTLIPHSRTADESEVRFKPTRAGVIGLWDYTDEEFVFADGRLVLRGHNGSGKTKALEVLFPLVLDGVLDARRLDPFSGEERTMKSNLLYKGQESAYGYVWMEFARANPDGEVLEAVTTGIGMRVTKAMSTPARFFFVTDGRVGIDFGLLDGASRPLREKALEALLGKKAIFDTAEAYREKIDDRLFGLGRERYSQLVSLLLQLRRPLLAKDLDPVKLSETLTAGLRPVDDGLILQAARDFENLAEIQALLNALSGRIPRSVTSYVTTPLTCAPMPVTASTTSTVASRTLPPSARRSWKPRRTAVPRSDSWLPHSTSGIPLSASAMSSAPAWPSTRTTTPSSSGTASRSCAIAYTRNAGASPTANATSARPRRAWPPSRGRQSALSSGTVSCAKRPPGTPTT